MLGLTRWPRYTRVAYAQTLQVASLPYIKAAELGGAGSLRILCRHVLPNIAGPLLVVATAEFGLMILFEAGLSFLGLGIQPPQPSWGSIMSAGRQYVERAWWITLFPGAFLFLLVLSVNVLGDWLRDRLDPRSRTTMRTAMSFQRQDASSSPARPASSAAGSQPPSRAKGPALCLSDQRGDVAAGVSPASSGSTAAAHAPPCHRTHRGSIDRRPRRRP